MQVFVNQESQEVQEDATIQELVKDMGYTETDGIAVAINDQVIPKNTWETQPLNPEDSITLIRATQGG